MEVYLAQCLHSTVPCSLEMCFSSRSLLLNLAPHSPHSKACSWTPRSSSSCLVKWNNIDWAREYVLPHLGHGHSFTLEQDWFSKMWLI